MINKCVICGKEFEAKQSNYIICSNECRTARIKQYRQKQIDEIRSSPELRADYIRRSREYYKAHKPARYCKICGGVITDKGKHAHPKCVFQAAVEAISEGYYPGDSRIVRATVTWGYSIKEIKQYMKENNIPIVGVFRDNRVTKPKKLALLEQECAELREKNSQLSSAASHLNASEDYE